MNLKFIDVICLVTIFQIFLLIFVLVNQKKGSILSNRILSAFLFVNALLVIHYLLFHIQIFTKNRYPYIYFPGKCAYFLLIPLLFLYFKSICYKNFKLQKRTLVHFVPYIVCTIALLLHFYLRIAKVTGDSTSSFYLLLNWSERKIFLQAALGVQYFNEGMIFYYIALAVQSCFYISIFRDILKYKKSLKEKFSAIEKINLSWLIIVFFALYTMLIINSTNTILDLFNMSSMSVNRMLIIASLIIQFCFATIIVYKGLKTPEILIGIKPEGFEKQQKSALSDATIHRYLKKLEEYMDAEKPYLIPAITLDELAEKVSISSRSLSIIINNSLDQNFFDFINSYRIKDSKGILSDPASSHKTVLEVLYEVGFNSKSVFNTVFKKQTGLTPTQYKKMSMVN